MERRTHFLAVSRMLMFLKEGKAVSANMLNTFRVLVNMLLLLALAEYFPKHSFYPSLKIAVELKILIY